jgi:tRNA(Ile)-lysidine synthase TilS/MesJ
MYTLNPKIRCSKCVLSGEFPGINFNNDGECNYCLKSEGDRKSLKKRRIEWLNNIESIFVKLKEINQNYHCVVALSGGKDSSYTLQLLTEKYNLRCLAVTIDNGFFSDLTLENCRSICDQLGVDHLLYKPSKKFMDKLIAESAYGGLHVGGAIMRASDICNSCINLINSYMIKIAISHKVPVIAGGYLGGQVPKDAVIMKISPKALKTGRYHTEIKMQERLGVESMAYFDIGNAEQTQLTIINPLLAMEYSEGEIINSITKLGWVRPVDTGALSSNCRLNDAGIFIHFQKYKFHPYELEFAELVRNGFIDRNEAIAKLETKPSIQELQAILNSITLKNE